MDPKIRRAARITGTVQGVGFRYRTRERARELGVTGWVRNNRDGSVSVEVQGDPDAVGRLLRWARTGPRHASVSGVQLENRPIVGAEADFEIIG